MKAAIITIGDEILLGQITDTNSRFAAAHLSRLGIDVVEMYSISDDPQAITQILDEALAVADVLIVTGGLGPTKDDVTKKVLADYFHTKLVWNETAYQWVQAVLSSNPRLQMNEYNKSQAMLPQDCLLLHNEKGTASGMWFERDGKIVISLPGVPFEMEHLLVQEVLPRLAKCLKGDVVQYRMLTVFEVPESELAQQLQNYEEQLPPVFKLAYLPSPGYVRLRLTTKEASGAAQFETQWEKLTRALSGHLVSQTDIEPEQYFVQEIAKQGVTVAVAESCTGGNIARLLTERAGASAYFAGGVVAYANEVKIRVLGVQENDLKQYGAVSRPVAEQMAQGVRRITKAQWAVATTGIAGPSGGSPEKPVGTVWIAVAGPNETWAQEFHFASVRQRNIAKASMQALACLLAHISQR